MALVILTISRLLLFPNPNTMPQPMFKIPNVYTSIFPLINSIPFWEPIHVISFIYISIGKFLKTFSMFQSILEFTFIDVSSDPMMDATSRGHSSPPVSLVILSRATSLNYFHGCLKPKIYSLSMFLISLKLSDVYISSGINLVALFDLLIICKPSFIDSSLVVY